MIVRTLSRTRAAGALERGEVVRADEHAGRRAHRVDVERLRQVPHERALERVGDRAVADLVAIGLRARAEAGVKLRRHLFDGEHTNVLRKLRVERARQRRRHRART